MIATAEDRLFERAVSQLRERYEESKRQRSDVLFGVSINMKRGVLQEARNPIEDRLKPTAA